jgi:hypothetical protein
LVFVPPKFRKKYASLLGGILGRLGTKMPRAVFVTYVPDKKMKKINEEC